MSQSLDLQHCQSVAERAAEAASEVLARFRSRAGTVRGRPRGGDAGGPEESEFHGDAGIPGSDAELEGRGKIPH